MPEVSNKVVRPMSSGKRGTENKPKLNGTKPKIQTTESKGKESEKSIASGLKKQKILTKDKSKNPKSKEEANETLPKVDSKQKSSAPIELKPKPTINEQNQNGKIPGISRNNVNVSNIESAKELKEPQSEAKKVTKKDSEKKVFLPTQLSIENGNQPETTVDITGYSTQISMPLEKHRTFVTNNDSWIMSNIPYIPLGLAVVYLILNILIPGLGTILSGFSILCCGKCRVQTKDDQRLVTVCVNACVGVSQLFTVTFLLVGWFWSIAWGVNMVLLAVDLRRQKKEQREKEIQTSVLNAFGNSVPMRNLFSGIK